MTYRVGSHWILDDVGRPKPPPPPRLNSLEQQLSSASTTPTNRPTRPPPPKSGETLHDSMDISASRLSPSPLMMKQNPTEYANLGRLVSEFYFISFYFSSPFKLHTTSFFLFVDSKYVLLCFVFMTTMAYLGDIRSAITPKKPERSASMKARERSMAAIGSSSKQVSSTFFHIF